MTTPLPDQLGDLLRQDYDRASFAGDVTALDRGEALLGAVEARLALARGRFLHARYQLDRQERPGQREQLERALERFGQAGDRRGEGEARLWLGIYHQVVRDDTSTAEPYLRSAAALAGEAGDELTLSYAERHIGFVEMQAGRPEQARVRFEESVRLRRRLGYTPGVAAGLVALAELDAEQGDAASARRRLDEAQALAESCGATAVLHWAGVARADLDADG